MPASRVWMLGAGQIKQLPPKESLFHREEEAQQEGAEMGWTCFRRFSSESTGISVSLSQSHLPVLVLVPVNTHTVTAFPFLFPCFKFPSCSDFSPPFTASFSLPQAQTFLSFPRCWRAPPQPSQGRAVSLRPCRQCSDSLPDSWASGWHTGPHWSWVFSSHCASASLRGPVDFLSAL